MRRALAVCALWAIAGCASYSGYGLQPGVATRDDVIRVMGTPAQRTAAANGETVLWYPRLPYGRESFAARIAPDGKLVAIEQRLAREYFSQLKPNAMRRDDVLALVGPPYRITQFKRLDREVWDYPTPCFMTCELLVVQFSPDGVMREAFRVQDPEALSYEGGPE